MVQTGIDPFFETVSEDCRRSRIAKFTDAMGRKCWPLRVVPFAQEAFSLLRFNRCYVRANPSVRPPQLVDDASDTTLSRTPSATDNENDREDDDNKEMQPDEEKDVASVIQQSHKGKQKATHA